MHKQFWHRLTARLRIVAAGLLAVQSFASESPGPLYAQNPDVIMMGVYPVSTAPPGAIADLLASANPAVDGQISLTWTAPQGNAGGTPLANQPVAAYIIHYSTFGVADMGNNSTAWWNATNSSRIMLQAPDATPKNPGGSESYAFSDLTPGATFYFGVESISQGGIVSPIDTHASTLNQQAKAVSTLLFVASGQPLMPTGLSTTLNAGVFNFHWDPVMKDTSQQPISIDHYHIDRYDSLTGLPSTSFDVPGSTTTFSNVVGRVLYFYRVTAVSTGNSTSSPSDFVDSSDAGNRYFIAEDDPSTMVVVPRTLVGELNHVAPSGDDLEIKLIHRPQDEVDITLRSYHIGAYKTSDNTEVPGFSFSQSGISVELGLNASIASGHLTTTQVTALQQGSRAPVGSIAQIVSVYWNNGSGFIRVSDPVLTGSQALSVTVRALGVYQIRAVQIGTKFRLSQGSPYPRVITPNDPSQNNRVFFFFENPTDDAVKGTIYDIRGAHVRTLVMNGQSPTGNALVWDGRDDQGAVVPTGVYLYKISTSQEAATGTVVVAR